MSLIVNLTKQNGVSATFEPAMVTTEAQHHYHIKFDVNEGEIGEARDKAIEEMMKRAEKLGANAIIGIDVDYEVLGEKNGMLMVSVSGTAVVVK